MGDIITLADLFITLNKFREKYGAHTKVMVNVLYETSPMHIDVIYNPNTNTIELIGKRYYETKITKA